MTKKKLPKVNTVDAKRQRAATTFEVDATEKAALEALLQTMRATKARLKEARDPKSSREAYAATFRETDRVAQMVVEAAEEEADDDDDDVVVDGEGIIWRSAGRYPKTYASTRGPLRITRRLFRCERNGPTRCFFDERRGVVDALYMQDLGRAVVMGVALLPPSTASGLLELATGYPVATASMQRTAIATGDALRAEEQAFIEAIVDKQEVPAHAETIVVSVDALSFTLRDSGAHQACVACISLLDDVGERIGQTIRLGETPELGKQTIMERVEREVASLIKRRPDLDVVVVIDGAVDLRRHLLERFPFARHITDFYHVMEHIAAGLREVPFDDEETRRKQRRAFCKRLKTEPGAATEIIAWLRDSAWVHPNMAATAQNVVGKHANYLENQRDFLDYADALAAGCDIGSGPVEAACKTIVTQRLKISGATWSEGGAGAIIHLRSVLQSGRFSDALDFRALRPAA